MRRTFVIPSSSLEKSTSKSSPADFVISSCSRVVPFARTQLNGTAVRVADSMRVRVSKTYASKERLSFGRTSITSGHATCAVNDLSALYPIGITSLSMPRFHARGNINVRPAFEPFMLIQQAPQDTFMCHVDVFGRVTSFKAAVDLIEEALTPI